MGTKALYILTRRRFQRFNENTVSLRIDLEARLANANAVFWQTADMKRKWLALSALALILVGAGLFWAKWKQDNPTPTAQDLMVRQHLINAKEVWITGAKRTEFFHTLSPKERAEIARNIFLLPPTEIPPFPGKTDYRLNFGIASKFSDTLYIDKDYSLGVYNNLSYPQETAVAILPTRVHPATSKYIYRWIEGHLKNGKWVAD